MKEACVRQPATVCREKVYSGPREDSDVADDGGQRNHQGSGPVDRAVERVQPADGDASENLVR